MVTGSSMVATARHGTARWRSVIQRTSRLDFVCTASNQFGNLVGLDRRASVGVIPPGLGGEGVGQVVDAILLLVAGISCLVDAGEDSRHLEAGQQTSSGTARGA